MKEELCAVSMSEFANPVLLRDLSGWGCVRIILNMESGARLQHWRSDLESADSLLQQETYENCSWLKVRVRVQQVSDIRQGR